MNGSVSLGGGFFTELTGKFTASYQIYATKAGTPGDKILDVLKNWWDAYPNVKSSPPKVTAEEVASLIRDPTKSRGVDYAIIDVRRNDHAVC